MRKICEQDQLLRSIGDGTTSSGATYEMPKRAVNSLEKKRTKNISLRLFRFVGEQVVPIVLRNLHGSLFFDRTYELTLYMDLWNDELIAHALSSTRGDRMIYLNGLRDVIEFKKQYPNQELVFNEERPAYVLGYLTPK